jgi:hypothetical protein
VLDRLVDQIDTADEIGVIVETTYKVGQTLGCVCGQMVDIVEPVFVEKVGDEVVIHHASPYELCSVGNMVFESSAEVVENDYFMAERQTMLNNMGADESCSAGNK